MRRPADRSLAPAYDPGSAPTAKFLDPPQIVPESESGTLSSAGDDDGPGDSASDSRSAARNKRKDSASRRPEWSPYR